MTRPLILFGAFDRHNFGDLLLAHCAIAARPGRNAVLAGLADRDLRPFGGHHVQTLDGVIRSYGDEAADFVHVGGEILTTTAWEVAVMLQTREEAARAIATWDSKPAARGAWAASVLGTNRQLPYVCPAFDLPPRWNVHFDAVGGVGLRDLPHPLRDEAIAALRTATSVSVRDATTFAALRQAGVEAALVRDPAATTAARFAPLIARYAVQGEPARIARSIPRRLAVQIAADWGDDATLDAVASAAHATAVALRAGIVLFRAGTAPWHDDDTVLDRLATRLRASDPQQPPARFGSTHVFDLCALLAGSVDYLGTSLHGWIVADSFGVPATCLVASSLSKASAYLDTWGGPVRCWLTRDELPACGSLLPTG
jgi:hypothetical protein